MLTSMATILHKTQKKVWSEQGLSKVKKKSAVLKLAMTDKA